jgi:hypothetical protein
MVGNVCGLPTVLIICVGKIDHLMAMMFNAPSVESQLFLMKKA